MAKNGCCFNIRHNDSFWRSKSVDDCPNFCIFEIKEKVIGTNHMLFILCTSAVLIG